MRGYSGEFSKRRLFSFFSSSFLVAAIIVQRMFVCGRSSEKGTPGFADHVQARGKRAVLNLLKMAETKKVTGRILIENKLQNI